MSKFVGKFTDDALASESCHRGEKHEQTFNKEEGKMGCQCTKCNTVLLLDIESRTLV